MSMDTTIYRLLEEMVEKAFTSLHDKLVLGRGDAIKTLHVVGRPNFVWARDITGSNSLLQVRCTKITPSYGLTVYAKRGLDGVVEVVGQDDQSAEKYWKGKIAGNGGPHALTHGYFGNDPILVDGRQFIPLLCLPNNPADLLIRVFACILWTADGATAYSGGTLDLASHVPSNANEQRIVVVGLTVSTKTLTAIPGSAKTVASTDVTRVPFSDTEVAAIEVVDGIVPIAAVRLYNGQTVVNIHDVFKDLRPYFVMPWAAGSGSDSGGESGDDLHAGFFGGRLTAVSGDPNPTSDQTAVTTVYCTPSDNDGNALSVGYAKLWDTTLGDWITHQFAEISASVPATTNTLYDVFFYYDGADYQLQFVAWTNDTTRATALGTEGGVKVMESDHSKLWIGKIRTTGVSGQTEDAGLTQDAKRYINNEYNQVEKRLYLYDDTNSWTTTSTTFEQLRGQTFNKVSFIQSSRTKKVWLFGGFNTFNSGASTFISVGIDSTTVSSADIFIGGGGTNTLITAMFAYNQIPSEGEHEAVVLQKVQSGTSTIFGDNGAGVTLKSAMTGHVWG